MSIRPRVLGCLLLLAAVIALPYPGARAAGEPKQSPLAEVKALEKPVTVSETKIPLGELIQKIAAETGARLVAAPSVADEPMAVAVRELPARDLLEQLAALLDYLWSKRGKEGEARYEIWQDVAARQREEALREAAVDAVQKRLDEEVGRYVEVAALPVKQLQSLSAEYQRWHEWFYGLPWSRRQELWPEQWERIQRPSIAYRLSSGVNRSLATILGRLTREQRARLRAGETLIFGTNPQPGQPLLPAEIVDAFRAVKPSMDDGRRHGDAAETEGQRQQQQEMERQWSAATGYLVSLRLDASRLRKEGSLTLAATAIPHGVDVDWISGFRQAEGTSLNLSIEAFRLDDPAEGETPERRAALSQDPVVGAKRRFTLEPKQPASGRLDGRFLRDLLPEIARIYGVSIIADSYWVDRTMRSLPGEEPIALWALLDRSTRAEYRWDHRGKLIRIRYRAWPFARPREVPLRLVRRWEAIHRSGGAIPFDDLGDAAENLTDLQMESAPQIVPLSALFQLHRARPMLRLYRSLPVHRQGALWQGQSVVLGDMTPAQRGLFLTPLQPREPDPDQALVNGSASLPSPEIGPTSRFSLQSLQFIRVGEKAGETVRYHIEPAPTPGSPLSPAPRPPASAAGRPASLPTVTRQPIARVTLQCLYSSERKEEIELEVAAPGAGLPPVQ